MCGGRLLKLKSEQGVKAGLVNGHLMKHKASKKNRIPTFMAWCLLALCLIAIPAMAQIPAEPAVAETAESTWQAPDLTSLRSDWWLQLGAVSTEVSKQRLSQFLAALEQRVAGLSGDELVTAQNRIANLKSLFELLALARQGPLDQRFDPPLTKESYFLDDVLNLRAQWRGLTASAAQASLQIEQTQRQVKILLERRDKLLRDYSSTKPESPSRMLSGLRRISARAEYELALARTKYTQQVLKQIETQRLLLNEQQAFARDRLVSTDISLADIESLVVEARARVVAMTEKIAAQQPQLLNVLSAETVNSSLELLRKQQLTRASAEAELAELQELLLVTKSNWYYFRANELDSGFDLQSAMAQSRRITADSLKQAELWSLVSQTTLITPSSDTSLNTVKNFEIAQRNNKSNKCL